MASSRLKPEQFVLLIAKHDRRVRAFIATLLPFDRDAVDDILQTTYLVAWEKLADFHYEAAEPDEEVVRWIIAIARLEAFTFLRSSKKHKHAGLSEAVLNRIADMQQHDWDHFEARWRAFTRCVEKLDKSQKELIQLRYGSGLNPTEIGARWGKAPNTVSVTMARIRKALEKCITANMRKEGYC